MKVLKAFDGDSLLITFGEGENIKNILIDGGIPRTYYQTLKKELLDIKGKGQFIDLLIVTHIDNDHIGGISSLFKDNSMDKSFIKKVWFNSQEALSRELKVEIPNSKGVELGVDSEQTKMSLRQARTLEEKLDSYSCWEQVLVCRNEDFVNYSIGESRITVLSPRIQQINKWIEEEETNKMAGCEKDYKYPLKVLAENKFKEDDQSHNKSSISIIIEYKGKKILLLADSHPSDIVQSLRELGYDEQKKLVVDYVKVSHHGSKKNTSDELLKLIGCKNYIFTTNGSKHCLPNKESMARIVKNCDGDVDFFFNYPIFENIFLKEEQEDYRIRCWHKNILEV